MTKADIHPEHIHPDYEEIDDRLEELGIERLSDDTGISYDEKTEVAKLHSHLHAYTPWFITALSMEEMWALVEWWLDGYCSVCRTEIPQAHYLCRACLEEAMTAWGVRRI